MVVTTDELRNIQSIKTDDNRAEKGRRIALLPGTIEHIGEEVFTVRSQSGPGSYKVLITPRGPVCNGEDFKKRNLPCKHAASIRFYIEKQITNSVGETVSERVPITYPQAWSAYNQAQMAEVRHFDILLHDLLADIEEEEQGMGRPKNGLRHDLFCAVQNVYSQLSCRRSHCLFGFAVERGQLPKAPGFVVSSRALNREDVTLILENLITRTALPLAAIEEGFAPDSTNMQTTSFGAWREEKHGERRDHVWLKAHALVGTKTHVVVRVSVTDKDCGDQPQFEALLREAARAGFPLREVYADKAYSARANYVLAEELKFDLYVPFKSNSRGQTTNRCGATAGISSKLWRKAFLLFQMHREEFEAK
jgi:hypothetical protein